MDSMRMWEGEYDAARSLNLAAFALGVNCSEYRMSFRYAAGLGHALDDHVGQDACHWAHGADLGASRTIAMLLQFRPAVLVAAHSFELPTRSVPGHRDYQEQCLPMRSRALPRTVSAHALTCWYLLGQNGGALRLLRGRL